MLHSCAKPCKGGRCSDHVNGKSRTARADLLTFCGLTLTKTCLTQVCIFFKLDFPELSNALYLARCAAVAGRTDATFTSSSASACAARHQRYRRVPRTCLAGFVASPTSPRPP